MTDLPALAPLANPRLLRDQVKDVIKSLIIDGNLPAGTRLVEVSLANELHVSRQPVREALQSLASEGWVDFQPRLGASVHQPTAREVADVFKVRVVLEGLSAQLAAVQIDSEGLDALRDICSRGRKAVAEERPEAVALSNSEFHLFIAKAANNATLRSFLAALDNKIRWYFRPIATVRGYDSWDEHEELVGALADRRADDAASIMRAHVSRTQFTLDNLSDEEGDTAKTATQSAL